MQSKLWNILQPILVSSISGEAVRNLAVLLCILVVEVPEWPFENVSNVCKPSFIIIFLKSVVGGP